MDSKSLECIIHAGSSPASGTISEKEARLLKRNLAFLVQSSDIALKKARIFR
jgi:hypothetical protein